MSRLPGSPVGPPGRGLPIPWAHLPISFQTTSRGAPSPGSPNRAPAERGAHFLEPSFNISKFPVNGPWRGSYGKRHPFPELSSTRPLIVHLSLTIPSEWASLHVPQHCPHRERCSVSRANSLLIHLYLTESPIKEPSHEKHGHRPRSPMRTEGLRTMGCGLVPQGDHLWRCFHYPSAMQPSVRYLPPWLGYARTLLASMCHSNPHQGIPSTPVYSSHMTQGRVRILVSLRYRWGVGFMGGMHEGEEEHLQGFGGEVEGKND